MVNRHLETVVLGLGPVGSILAGHLSAAGNAVRVVEHQKELRLAIARDGIKINGYCDLTTTALKTYTSLGQLRGCTIKYLFVATKAFQNAAVCRGLSNNRLQPQWLICCQNGLGVEAAFCELLGPERVLRLVINYAGNLVAPGLVQMSFFNPPNYLGSSGDQSEPELASKLTGAGLSTEWSFQIHEQVWRKTIYNLAFSATAALLNQSTSDITRNPDAVDLASAIINEALCVAKADGVKLPDDLNQGVCTYLATSRNHQPSLAVDLQRGNVTEVDFLYGRVVELGQRYGIATPSMKVLTTLIKAAARASRQQIMATLEQSRIRALQQDRSDPQVTVYHDQTESLPVWELSQTLTDEGQQIADSAEPLPQPPTLDSE